MKRYKILMHDMTYKKATAYLSDLETGKVTAGSYLLQSLKDNDISQLSVDDL